MEEVLLFIILIPLGLLILGLLAGSLIWVYRDAEKRGKSGCLVALLVFLLEWPISLLVWLVFRPDLKQHNKN
ncbi:MAG: hypothetical protein WBB64_05890 [Anaerolineales bacterium]|jgi:hypothetical protein